MSKHTSFKDYYLSLINKKKQGVFPDLIKRILSLVSYLYRGILWFRLLIYQKGFTGKTTLTVPVISVGNITLGGTGKTPFIEYIAIYLRNKGKRVAILSRGYGAKKKNDKTYSAHNDGKPEVYNDEYLMLRENLVDIPNLINRDRISSGIRAIEEYKVDCLLLDDGFQHIKLNRSLDIVVINSLNPFGYEHVFPRGFLREPLQNLQRANLFVIAHSDLCTHSELEKLRGRLNRIDNDIPVIEAVHHPLHIENIKDGTNSPVGWLNGKRIYAFCAIGNPESFSRSLLCHGARLIKFDPFIDHHFYTRNELDDIRKEAEHLNVDAIVTTQKDKVKIFEVLTKEDLKTYSIPFGIFKIAIKIENGAEILEKLIDNIFTTRLR